MDLGKHWWEFTRFAHEMQTGYRYKRWSSGGCIIMNIIVTIVIISSSSIIIIISISVLSIMISARFAHEMQTGYRYKRWSSGRSSRNSVRSR